MTRPLTTGDYVELMPVSGRLSRHANRRGEVAQVISGGSISVADVLFDGDTAATRDIAVSYLTPVKRTTNRLPSTGARRGALHLHAPKDERTEKDKQADAKTFLLSYGYSILEVGQSRSAAVCYGCIADANREAAKTGTEPRRVGPMICPTHKRPVYSMDTGSDAGVSDWQIRHTTRWPEYTVLLVEWKRDPKAKRREAQVRLSDAGWYPIVDSLADLCAWICHFEVRFYCENITDLAEKANWEAVRDPSHGTVNGSNPTKPHTNPRAREESAETDDPIDPMTDLEDSPE